MGDLNLSRANQMQDVSNIFDHFRESARTIWNTAFWPDPDFHEWDSIDRFVEIQRLLFDELVLAKLGRNWPIQDIFRVPMPFFFAVPRSQIIPILIQNPRPGSPSGYWDHPVNQISQGAAEMQFLAYFDWDRMDYVDFHYYHLQIKKFDAQPELVGREALIERQCTRIFTETLMA
jgi:hypothetical protein